MKKIIHLSDIHVGGINRKKFGGENLTVIFNRIIDNIIISDKIQNDSTIIVITGDIAHRVNQDSYCTVKNRLENLNKKGFDIFLVPGNHDYKKGKVYKKKYISNFLKAFSELLFENNIHVTDENNKQFPIAKIVDEGTENSIALIGLDSMEGKITNCKKRRKGRGSFGKPQLIRLNELLSHERIINSSKKIICFHHRLLKKDRKPEIDDWKTLHEVILKHNNLGTKIDAILYGHKHDGISEPNMWGIVPRCYDGSSSTGRRRRKKIKPIIQRIIDLSSNDLTTDENGKFHI